MPTLVAVVPAGHVQPLLRRGWTAGRCNAYTTTLSREFESADHAVVAGRALPAGWVWSIEGVPRE